MKPTSGIAVDGSCLRNPGPVQWQGIDLATGQRLFQSASYEGGTNNIAEFLAIIHALAMTKGTRTKVYSDSQTARIWVSKGRCSIDSVRSDQLLSVVTRANNWLGQHPQESSRVDVWLTKEWGENSADFGRKTSTRK